MARSEGGGPMDEVEEPVDILDVLKEIRKLKDEQRTLLDQVQYWKSKANKEEK